MIWHIILVCLLLLLLQPTVPASDRAPPKIGNLGHLTRLANRLIQAANSNPDIKGHLEVP